MQDLWPQCAVVHCLDQSLLNCGNYHHQRGQLLELDRVKFVKQHKQDISGLPLNCESARSFLVSNKTSGSFEIGTQTSVANPY